MNIVKISPKFQVVIPKEIRKKSGLKVGANLEIISYGNRIELIPKEPITKLKGFLKGIKTDIQKVKDRI